jgi:hypothetical protein
MGLESKRKEQAKDPLILAQVVLAQIAFGSDDHKKATAEWLAGGGSSLAVHFREYIEAHPDETIEVDDKNAMKVLLEKIRTYH